MGDSISIDPSRYRVDELRSVLAGESRAVSKELALLMLAQKDYPEEQRLTDLRSILAAEEEPSRLRQAAAVSLRNLGTPGAAATLQAALDTSDSRLGEVITSALTTVSGYDAASRGGGATLASSEPVQWAATLRSYLNGSLGGGLSMPAEGELLGLDSSRATPIDVGVPPEDVAARAAAQAMATSEPVIQLASAGAVELRCGDRQHMFLWSSELAPTSSGAAVPIDHLVTRKALIGAVAVLYGLESQAWSVKYYVLAQPDSAPEEGALFLTTTTGTVALAGRARLEGERVAVEISSLQQPGALPIAISAEVFAAGQLDVTRALVEVERVPKLSPEPAQPAATQRDSTGRGRMR